MGELLTLSRRKKTKPVVYCAGKIAKNDWRTQLFGREIGSMFNELSPEELLGSLLDGDIDVEALPWLIDPVVKDGFIYGGPFFIGCDHGCYHGPGTHGMGKVGKRRIYGCDVSLIPGREVVAEWCLRWIDLSDYLFAWIHDSTIYGTLSELGWAKAKGKPIFIGFENSNLCSEMWFASVLADKCVIESRPELAWKAFVDWVRSEEVLRQA